MSWPPSSRCLCPWPVPSEPMLLETARAPADLGRLDAMTTWSSHQHHRQAHPPKIFFKRAKRRRCSSGEQSLRVSRDNLRPISAGTSGPVRLALPLVRIIQCEGCDPQVQANRGLSSPTSRGSSLHGRGITAARAARGPHRAEVCHHRAALAVPRQAWSGRRRGLRQVR